MASEKTPTRPNLFVVGAMKSATTALAAYLDRHPTISVADPKEPCRFVDPDVLRTHWPTMWARRYWADDAAYLGLFRRDEGTRYLCDASTLYAKLPDIPGVAERIKSYEPDARILYIMREPAARAISHYWHAFRAGAETRPIETAIWAEPSAYRAYGHYPMQLKPYLEAFGESRVYLLLTERLEARPAEVVNAVFQWLDLAPLDPANLPPMRSHVGPTVSENPTLQSPLYRALRADWLNPLKRLLPGALKARVKTGLGGATDRASVDTAQLYADLREYYATDRAWLAARLGDGPREWAWDVTLQETRRETRAT